MDAPVTVPTWKRGGVLFRGSAGRRAGTTVLSLSSVSPALNELHRKTALVLRRVGKEEYLFVPAQVPQSHRVVHSGAGQCSIV